MLCYGECKNMICQMVRVCSCGSKVRPATTAVSLHGATGVSCFLSYSPFSMIRKKTRYKNRCFFQEVGTYINCFFPKKRKKR